MKFVVLWVLVGCFYGIVSLANSPDAESIKMASEKLYDAALIRFQSEAFSAEDAWKLARVAFDFAEHLDPSDRKESVARQGIAAARACVQQSSQMAEGYYYLALNLGQLARCRRLGALKLVREMEKAFLKARELNASLDFAGPDRCLGRLYLQAPGWPASVGSSRKAMEHLTEAMLIYPEYPGNVLQLVHACQELNRSGEASRYFRMTHQITQQMNQNWADRLPPIVLVKWRALLKDIQTTMSEES
jgi:tetratricopeptide (TPR) repeat protein